MTNFQISDADNSVAGNPHPRANPALTIHTQVRPPNHLESEHMSDPPGLRTWRQSVFLWYDRSFD